MCGEIVFLPLRADEEGGHVRGAEASKWKSMLMSAYTYHPCANAYGTTELRKVEVNLQLYTVVRQPKNAMISYILHGNIGVGGGSAGG